MPIRQTKAKLWFDTKEEADQYDARMIANIEIKSNDADDDNYSPVFGREKSEFFLTLGDKAKADIAKIKQVYGTPVNYLEKFVIGKVDNSYDRNMCLHKEMLQYTAGYFLLRELPIRNFYARCWIMLTYYCSITDKTQGFLPYQKGMKLQFDDWTAKDIRNYAIFNDRKQRIVPNEYNKISDSIQWRRANLGFLRHCPERHLTTLADLVIRPKVKTITWDGTFNMPTYGVIHPLSKDCKSIDFITQ